MSLKAFHLVFIVASILLAIGFGVWSYLNYSAPQGTTSDLVVAIISGTVALGLVGYEIYFLKKLKNVSYL
jgi:hypothetical protein